MAIRMGIVGLPNVGKSTLFNALSSGGAESANFPFCTIEPNVGIVPVPDPRLDVLAEIFGSEKIIPTTLEFVDIAGLVKGASKGEGLGNQFLAHIREVDAIAHVVRCFADENIVHVQGDIDPASDVEVIDTELALRDLETVEKRLNKSSKEAKGVGEQGKIAKAELPALEQACAHLDQGKPLRTLKLSEDALVTLRGLHLLTVKPVLFIANVAEADIAAPHDNPYVKALDEVAKEQHSFVIPISAAIESELAELSSDERTEYLAEVGIEEPGLNTVIRRSYELLGLLTYLTAGPKESRAWTVRDGASAPEAAGVIHSDFERGFIRVEVTRLEDLQALGSEAAVKAAGKLRVEGKEYRVVDGDVMHFRFNV